MTFQDRLKQIAADVDRSLEGLLPVETAAAMRVVEAMRYSSIDQGKRLRPFLVVESAAVLGGDGHCALRTGTALECIHCYSLVHDDLPAMDDDELRRGKPTCHIAYGEAAAILAGDGLLTFAFEILADSQTHADPAVRCQLVMELARAAGKDGMVGGQMLDLQAEEKQSHDRAEIETIQMLKTGALFRFACESGAVLARAGDQDRSAMRTYADAIGLAFQIADDILDVESDAITLGKATQKDAQAGKATFIDLLGLDAARARARALADEACEALSAYGVRADHMRDVARFIVERKN